jgi:4-methylaminobutanoate oxidase (formaldehyde-forming)
LELFSLKNQFKQGKPLLLHDEPIFKNDKIVGYTTSSNYSFCYKKHICLAYIKNEVKDNDRLFIEVEGRKYALNLEKQPIHDPSSILMRS